MSGQRSDRPANRLAGTPPASGRLANWGSQGDLRPSIPGSCESAISRKYSAIARPKASDHGSLFRARRGDRLADRGQRRGIVEHDAFALLLQSEIAPEAGEIGRHGFRSHLAVKS